MLGKYMFVILLTFPLPAAGQQPAPTANLGRPVTPWAILREGLADGNTEHRRQAILAASSIGVTPESLKFIEQGLLNDKEILVRQTSAAVLGQMKATDSIHSLQQALDDKSPEVAFTAARSLVDMDDDMGRRFLVEVITGQRKDKPGFVEQNIRKAKKQLTPAEITLMGAKEATGVLFGPASLGIVVIEKVVKGSGSDHVSGRAIAAGELGEHPDNYTRTLLEWALTDNNPTVRAAAARGLGQCGNPDSIPKLQDAMNDQHTAVRMMAAAAVIRLMGHGGDGAPPSSAALK